MSAKCPSVSPTCNKNKKVSGSYLLVAETQNIRIIFNLRLLLIPIGLSEHNPSEHA